MRHWFEQPMDDTPSPTATPQAAQSLMSTPINLNKARKAKAKRSAKQQADENAVKFGRSKAEKERDKAERDSAIQKLDQHRREE